MFVPQTSQKSLFEVAQFYFHPLFLYESLAGLLILLFSIKTCINNLELKELFGNEKESQ
jgi:prolipoprotein diacylglyceryltransferase